MSITETHLPDDQKGHLFDLWQVADKAGLHSTPATLDAAILAYEAAQKAHRVAKAAWDEAKAVHDDALAMTEYDLGSSIVKEASKTFIVTGDDRRQVTADEAKDWVKREAAKDPEVITAAKALRAAETHKDETVDGLALADRRISAAKHNVDAAIALARLLTTTFEGGNR